MQYTHITTAVAVALSLATVAAHSAAGKGGGASVLQFRSNDFAGNSWKAVDGTEMYAAHADSEAEGWALPIKSGKAVNFGQDGEGRIASPLEFAFDDTNLVAGIYAVVCCAATTPLSTLVSAPSEALIESDEIIDVVFAGKDDAQTARRFEAGFMGQTNSVAVNGEETQWITPETRLQLVEFRFPRPCMRSEIYIGGSAASPRWSRPWRGAVCELILCGVPLAEEEANAVKRYLSVKFGLSIPTERDDAVVPILRALGIDDSSVFSTMVLLR